MSPWLYQKAFLGAMALVALAIGGHRTTSLDYSIQEKGSRIWLPMLMCLGLSFWIGLRPISGAFGDTVNYALEYATMDPRHISMDWHSEWIWQLLMNGCKAAGLSINVFFLIVAAGYVLSAAWAVYRFMPGDTMLGVVFLLTSLMFFPFAVNGLRNGLACHLVLLGASFLLDSKWLPGALICLVAFGIHRSTMLPIAALIVALFVMRNVKVSIIFWGASILVSLIAGGAISGIFAGLGFDDRMTQYVAIGDMSEFSRSGFRWDFLLYSAMPVVMAWYVCIKQQASDNWYDVLCTVYCLCNAFWIMVIRSAFSNRFAYLSWFLYPIVIAYPLVNLEIQQDQDRFTGLVLLAYAGFSVFMWFVVW
ncbi:MAG: EpsG family protein [Bacteroidales bacterium]|nr:EpsG family protein [Bacteroidales bacterium]